MEGVRRVVDTCQTEEETTQKKKPNKKPRAKELEKEAWKKEITLKRMPPQMTKYKQNKSGYISKKRMIAWTIEWILEASNQTILTHGYLILLIIRVLESCILGEELARHMKREKTGIFSYIRNHLGKV